MGDDTWFTASYSYYNKRKYLIEYRIASYIKSSWLVMGEKKKGLLFKSYRRLLWLNVLKLYLICCMTNGG